MIWGKYTSIAHNMNISMSINSHKIDIMGCPIMWSAKYFINKKTPHLGILSEKIVLSQNMFNYFVVVNLLNPFF